MVDIVEDTLPFLEIEKILGCCEEILTNHDALTGINVDTKLLIDFVTTNASKIVFLGIEEETFQKSAGIGSRGWITRAQLAIDVLEGGLFVKCKILLEGLNENLVFAGINDLHGLLTEGNKLANLDDAQRLAKLPCLRTLRLHNNPICDHPAYWSAMRRMVPDVRSLDGQFSALADASGGDGDVLAELNLPEPEPWLKGFKWDDAASGELAGSEEFQKVVTDCKRLSARAQSMLAEVKTPR